VYLALFGAPGIILIAVQLAAMPVLAAGIINGLGTTPAIATMSAITPRAISFPGSIYRR